MRLKKSSIAVLAALTMIIAGCSHGLGGRMSGGGSAETTVTFSVTDIPANYNDMIHQAQNPTSRSILPNPPITHASSNITLILTGTSNTGDSLSSTAVLQSGANFQAPRHILLRRLQRMTDTKM